jgi:glycine/sarcosine N-methyltransferase
VQGASERDRYSRTEYRRLIAWDRRIRREGPFLLGLLGEAPDRSVADLGCGTGEHVAFFAGQGARAVGLDSSESMIAQAREHEAAGKGRFVLADALRAREALGDEPAFGLAICLGNMLPHLLEEGDLRGFFRQTRDLLRPGGLFLLQVVNYRRILDAGVRHLPLSFAAGEHEGEEIVFLRLLRPAGPERLLFFPTTLLLDPRAEEPVQVKVSHRVELRPWTVEEVVPALEAAGFGVRLHGDMEGGPFDAATSYDLVTVGVRQ